MCFSGTGTFVTNNKYSLLWEHISTETVIPSDMCFKGTEAHITRAIRFPTRETNITRKICFPRRETHDTSEIINYVFPGKKTHITIDMTVFPG